MKATRVSKTIPAKRYSNFPNIMNYDKHHGLKKMCLQGLINARGEVFLYLTSTCVLQL